MNSPTVTFVVVNIDTLDSEKVGKGQDEAKTSSITLSSQEAERDSSIFYDLWKLKLSKFKQLKLKGCLIYTRITASRGMVFISWAWDGEIAPKLFHRLTIFSIQSRRLILNHDIHVLPLIQGLTTGTCTSIDGNHTSKRGMHSDEVNHLWMSLEHVTFRG
ncbi:hypothetical protein PM082_006255 [Marasmius tenuissimus]|nr:hypothetical protein PM082_006255 [Marasmius tenuissimus]